MALSRKQERANELAQARGYRNAYHQKQSRRTGRALPTDAQARTILPPVLGPSKKQFANAVRRQALGIPENPTRRREYYQRVQKDLRDWSDRSSNSPLTRYSPRGWHGFPSRDEYLEAFQGYIHDPGNIQRRAEFLAPQLGMTVQEFLNRYGNDA